MEENKKEKLDEEELSQNHDLWMNHKITDQQYFREINRIRSKIY
jgi:hypothetical protein